jgi:hypothetical protein
MQKPFFALLHLLTKQKYLYFLAKFCLTKFVKQNFLYELSHGQKINYFPKAEPSTNIIPAC